MKRTWSPLGAWRRCREGMVEGGKSRVLFRRVRRRETMECEDLVKEVRRGRLLCRRGGEGRVLLGVVFRRSSFDTYTIHTVSIVICMIER